MIERSVLLASLLLASAPSAQVVTKLNGALARAEGSGQDAGGSRFTSDGGWIVYSTFDPDDAELYAVPAGGSESPRALTSFPANRAITQYDCSANRVVVRVNEGTSPRELYSVPVDGSAPPTLLHPPLTPGGGVREFEISPDESWVVYRADQEVFGRFELYRAPIDGSAAPVKLNQVLVAGGDVQPALPSDPPFGLSPDGAWVVFHANAEVVSRNDLYAVPSDGSSSPVKLDGALVSSGNTRRFLVAPDSTRVVYRADAAADERFELFSAPIDGSAPPVKLNGTLPSGGDVEEFEVDATSSRVVFRADLAVNDRFELWRVPLAGGPAPVAINPPFTTGNVGPGVLAPDGSRVVFVLGASSTTLYSAPLDGSASPAPLDTGAGLYADIQVEADSTRAVYRARPAGGTRAELYSAELDGSAPPVRLNDELPAPYQIERYWFAGDRVVYRPSSGSLAHRGFFSVPLDGSASPVSLTEAAGEMIWLGWVAAEAVSPDGQQLAYVYDHRIVTQDSLWRVPTDGSAAPVEVSTGLAEPVVVGDVQRFAWSPDGTRALFTADTWRDEMQELYSFHLATATAVELNAPLEEAEEGLAGPEAVVDFAVDPASRRLAYRTRRSLEEFPPSTNYQLYGVPLDGGAVAYLTGAGYPIAYSVHAGAILYQIRHGFNDLESDLYRRPLDASLPAVWISSDPDVHSAGSWLETADASRVVYRHLSYEDDLLSLRSAGTDGITAPVAIDADINSLGGTFGVRLIPGGSALLFASDEGHGDVFELWRSPVDGSAPPVRLLPPYGPGQDVDGAFAIAADGTRVVFRADQDADEVFELYSVSTSGGSAVRLCGTMVAGGDVAAAVDGTPQFFVSPLGSRIVYRADQDVDGVVELYSAPIDGSQPPVKLNAALASGGSVEPNPVFSLDGSRVVYAADQDQNDVVELFVAPVDGSKAPLKLNPPLVAGGDVVANRLGGQHFEVTARYAYYLADQEQDELFELYRVSLSGGELLRVNAPLVAGGDVTRFAVGYGGRVLYLADQDQDETYELYLAELDVPPKAPFAPMEAPSRSRSR